MNENVVAINEQKVIELEARVRQLERANLELLVGKLQNEMMSIENATMYFRERAPRIQQEIEAAQRKLAGMGYGD